MFCAYNEGKCHNLWSVNENDTYNSNIDDDDDLKDEHEEEEAIFLIKSHVYSVENPKMIFILFLRSLCPNWAI